MADALDTMAQDLEAVRRERDAERERADALAAHVERLRPYVERLSNLCFHDEGSKDGVEEALSDTPTISLARRDARVKAEALEAFAQGLSINASNANENGYHSEADAMDDAANEALECVSQYRREAGVEQ